jgi:hypothetical protein
LELEVDPSDPPAARQAPKRPITVTFVALLLLVVGAYNLVDGVVVLVGGGDGSKVAEGAFELAFGLLAITIGNGAFRMRRWAWAAFMALALVGLTNQLIREFFNDDTNYLALGLITLAVLALTPLDVQIAFRVRPPRNVLLEQTRNPLDSV